jgi:hypothetical protein
MKIIIENEDWGAALAQWRGAEAALWIYHVSHKKLALMLSRKDESEQLYVVAVACKHIRGNFSWDDANLEIHADYDADSQEAITRVIDNVANFELICSSVTIARGPSTDLDKRFEGFMGDTVMQ